MSKYCSGFILAIVLIVGCAGSQTPAASGSVKAKAEQVPERLQVISRINPIRGSSSAILRDSKTGKEYLLVVNRYEGGISVIPIENDEE